MVCARLVHKKNTSKDRDTRDNNNNRYEYKPETVTENEEVTILWDMQTNTDRELSANKADSDQGQCQPMLQTYRCIGTIRPKHLDESQ